MPAASATARDVAKALALGADAIAIGHSALMALNCNKDIPEADYPKEIGVEAGQLLPLPYRPLPGGRGDPGPGAAQAARSRRGGGAGL